AGRAVALAEAHAAAGRFVGLVCPPTRRADLEHALAANRVEWSSADSGELESAVNLLSPLRAKGLEVDAVVVVEPEDIVAGDERAHRVLFPALTRPPRYLDMVCGGEPLPLSPPKPHSEPPRTEPDPTADPDELDRLARELAAVLTARAPAPQWDEV